MLWYNRFSDSMLAAKHNLHDRPSSDDPFVNASSVESSYDMREQNTMA
jgi:hypothetical protein